MKLQLSLPDGPVIIIYFQKKDLENAPAKSEKKIEELEKEVVELEEKQKVNQEEVC